MPEPDPDQQLMLDLLEGSGLDVSLDAWDDESVDWSRFDLCVLRSTWNYHARPDSFIEWCEGAAGASRLKNSVDVVRWNIHKAYLLELESEGLPIVPTAILKRGDEHQLQAVCGERGWNDVVVKPCVSAGSANTRRFGIEQFDAGELFLRELASERDVMIQPFMKSVEAGGERAAIMLGGELTHAIEKAPRFHDDDESVSEAKEVTGIECEMLESALKCVPGDVLYARLDTMKGDNGELLISELEIIEPSLFLLQSDRAQRAFVRAIESALEF
ncbi:MAG: hypothetical protein ED559_11520 [Phycisphaera sp.]|nr:MAG: hypothetical protein ED559_11520 [Phycisphaera sp.]